MVNEIVILIKKIDDCNVSKTITRVLICVSQIYFKIVYLAKCASFTFSFTFVVSWKATVSRHTVH